ncbi:NAD(P)-dependent oxidoreductase [Aquibium carbonis]|uniref:NAD(P)-dependent oxidoreductase n=1 Tax=Aquibium carbonis TaxID=2495581 RepID=A0A3S0A597_9HYPH|nr:NAD(P)-dependent oxidoreductase [Aquibium carbonis]RST85018.1 NAD(P)-dependent oxidoreductase [Aquibium carbonis]
MNIGMIGLGHMGSAMARRMIEGGHDVVGFDTSREAMDRLAAAGGQGAAHPREVADRAELVLACLPGKQASFDTAFGEHGVVHGARIRTYVEMSTLGRDAMTRIAGSLAAAGIGFLDAPVSGGPRGAAEGRLTAIVSGPSETIEAARPALAAVASNIFVIGPEPGMAQVCKLVNNILSITAMVATCEAVSMGVKAGLDARTMIDVINVSTGRNSATMDKFPKSILPRSFSYGGPLAIGLKDIDLYLELAHDMRMPAAIGTTVSGVFNHIASRLGAESDYSTMIKVFEEWGDVVVGDDPDTTSGG